MIALAHLLRPAVGIMAALLLSPPAFAEPYGQADVASPYGLPRAVSEDDFGDTLLKPGDYATTHSGSSMQAQPASRLPVRPVPAALTPAPAPLYAQTPLPAPVPLYAQTPAAAQSPMQGYVLRGLVQYQPVLVMTGQPNQQAQVFLVQPGAAAPSSYPFPQASILPVMVVRQGQPAAPGQTAAQTQAQASTQNQAQAQTAAPGATTADAAAQAGTQGSRGEAAKSFVNAVINVGGLFSSAATSRLSAAQPLLNLLLERL